MVFIVACSAVGNWLRAKPVDPVDPVDAVDGGRAGSDGSGGSGRCVAVIGCDCDSVVVRVDADSITLDDVLRSRSAGTGMGRGLRGMMLFFERPVGLSPLGGELRSEVVAVVAVIESTAGATGATGATGAAAAVCVVVVVVVATLSVVVTMVWLRGLVPETDMLAPIVVMVVRRDG